MRTTATHKAKPNDIETRSGRLINLRAPHVTDINIRDIAHALSQINRFTGHSRVPYNVAQHSVLCSTNAPKRLRFAALMHDAAEAYLGDISRPLKAMIPKYKIIERRMQQVIAKRYHLDVHDFSCDEIKEIDGRMLVTEGRDLGFAPLAWGVGFTPYSEPIQVWNAEQSAHVFLTAFRSLHEICRNKWATEEREDE